MLGELRVLLQTSSGLWQMGTEDMQVFFLPRHSSEPLRVSVTALLVVSIVVLLLLLLASLP